MTFNPIDTSDLNLRAAHFAPSILSRQNGKARQQYSERPLPLFPQLAAAAPYPVASLGPCLRLTGSSRMLKRPCASAPLWLSAPPRLSRSLHPTAPAPRSKPRLPASRCATASTSGP